MREGALAHAAATVCRNAERLQEDAGYLRDMERYSTAYALSILAQEEYGKAFILHLSVEQAVNWNAHLEKA